MTQEEFWQLIDKTRAESGNNPTKQAELLVKALTTMPVEDIFDYQLVHDAYFVRAYRADLWDAAEIIYSGGGDDGFMDFRAWLIGQGLNVYENALLNPDSLADIDHLEDASDTLAEDLLYVGQIAYEKKTNTEDGIPGRHKLTELNRDNECKTPDGDMKDFEKCLKERYPKVWAKFGW